MNTLSIRPACILLLALLLGAAAPAAAQDFQPDLGQAREIISGKDVARATIPPDANELTVYPLKAERPRQLLTALPGEPFRQVTPMPQARAWWLYPVYAALGLPRDLIDAAAGAINYIPVINIPVVMIGYELIPTQFLVRDPRDWHRWPGLRRNARSHGPIDGDSWGWFPSLNTWHFTYPSQRLARKNEIVNQQIKAKLDAQNRAIEEANAAIDTRLRDTRNRALSAIQAGNGREAAYRMIAYRHSYPLDEGGFALFATAMALYIADGPDWVAPVLWSELEFAQPRLLAEAERLLATTAQKHPERTALSEALIYTRLVLGRTQGATDAAQELLKGRPTDPYRLRLVFETALTDRNQKLARTSRAAMSPTSYDAPTRQLMDIRLALLAGQAAEVADTLAGLTAQSPEDPYYAYTLACARMELARSMENPAEPYRSAAALMTKARDLAPGPALRNRADRAAAWLQSVVEGISEKPELFSDAAPATTPQSDAAPATTPQAAPSGTGAPAREPAAAGADADTTRTFVLPPPPATEQEK